MKRYPPYDFLSQVLENYPRAGALYLMLWKEKDGNNKVFYTKDDVTDTHFLQWKKFKTDLINLQKQKVVEFSFNPSQDEVTIYLKPSQDVLNPL